MLMSDATLIESELCDSRFTYSLEALGRRNQSNRKARKISASQITSA